MQWIGPIPRRLATALLFNLYLPGAAIAAALDPAVERAPAWDLSKGAESRVIWKTALGGDSGALAFSNGKFIVSGSSKWTTSSATGRPENRGSVACIDAAGKLLWQTEHPRIGQRIHDMGQPIRSKACIDGNRVYYISNRSEFVCADQEGFRDGKNDGPFTGEEQTGHSDADFLWKLDMMAELGVYKREAGDVGNPLSSPIVIGDLVFCVTGHGRPVTGTPPARANPDAPSFLAVHKLTGKVAWSSNAPGRDILLGQWSSPAHARIAGINQVIFPGGDGCLYGFEAASGKLLWKLDCNEPGEEDWAETGLFWTDKGHLKKFFVATPIVSEGTLYIGLNLDYERPTPGPLLAIDLAAAGGVPIIKWKFQAPEFGSTYTSAAVEGGIVYIIGQEGTLFALDAKSGRELWQSRFEDERLLYASPVVHNGIVYAAGHSTVAAFAAGPEKKCLGRYEFDRGFIVTPIVAEDRLVVAAGSTLWALRLISFPE